MSTTKLVAVLSRSRADRGADRADASVEPTNAAFAVASLHTRTLDSDADRSVPIHSQGRDSSGERVAVPSAMMGEPPVTVLAGVAADRVWRFGGIEFDERTLDLRVAGEAIEVDPKPLGVLRFLLHHAGEIVTKDELAEAVWPRRILSDSVLAKTVSRLRDVLGDTDQSIVRTVHGYGYRLVANVEIEESFVPAPTQLNLKSGDHPPLRPLWRLEERLGSGGHGEAWRACHEKTREQRVFKFALDEASLAALKREITLFRVINDTVGEAARVVALLDWNLEQPPYFIEAEYLSGGSLIDWAAARGGLAAVPLADRLEAVAQIAEALAAVHAVGVLHKDLKPSNVLIEPVAGHAVDIRLADFGSGGILDIKRIEALGITRLGFTKTITALDSNSGTPLYLPPEVLAGQPFTVKADIYALGVMLYQFLAGDFRKVMSPGWERGIDDELLREDIALCAEGNLEARLGDAAELARRLRNLDGRRTQRAAERAKAAKAERVQRALERARARRVGLALAVAALVLGLIASTTLYFKARTAQARSEVAAAQSKSVTEFLTNDVFAPVSSGEKSVKETTVIMLLNQAGEEIDPRFAAQPEVASELHYVVGSSLNNFYESEAARKQFSDALEQAEKLQGAGSDLALRSASQLIVLDYALGSLRNTIRRYEDVLAQGQARLGRRDPSLLNLRLQLGYGYYFVGEWTKAAAELQRLVADVSETSRGPSSVEGRARFLLAKVSIDLGRYQEAKGELLKCLDDLGSTEGDQHIEVAEARTELGRVLTAMGDYQKAGEQLGLSQQLADRWAPQGTADVDRPRHYLAQLFLEQGQPASALPLLRKVLDAVDVYVANGGSELDHFPDMRQTLGETYQDLHRTDDAIASLEKAISVSVQSEGPDHPRTFSIRLSLAEVLLGAGRITDAIRVLGEAGSVERLDLPAMHPFIAQFARMQGLLAIKQGRTDQARPWFTKSLEIYSALYGTKNWRVARAQRDLLAVAVE